MKPEPTDRPQGLVSALPEWSRRTSEFKRPLVGVLPGEGIGPEIMDVTLQILELINTASGSRFEILTGGKIGLSAEAESGQALTQEVIDFCQSIFARQGALLCGPGGGRFVYNLRAHFDLYCKLTPIRPFAALADIGVIRSRALENVDMIIVRENAGGLYFGQWKATGNDPKSAAHSFEYNETQVQRILQAAIGLARLRRGKLAVVLKPYGVPSISALWRAKLEELVRDSSIDYQVLEIDNAMYQLIANASRFDVVVAPNMFGDVLSDGASLLLGSRGMSFSGNFGAVGRAVYQTGHGAAYDLAGTNRANPIAQLLSLAMMLRESFGLHRFASAIEVAIADTLQNGWRTADIAAPGSKVVGTRELGARVAANLETVLDCVCA